MDLKAEITERDHARGAASARVTLVEYGDFECRRCVRAYPLLRELLKRFEGDVRLVFRHSSQSHLYAHARLAAQAAEAAGLQNSFWRMHDALFEHTGTLDEPVLVRYAMALGLEVRRFQRDLYSAKVRERLREDQVSGSRSGVVETPTFFVNGAQHRAEADFDTLNHAIRDALLGSALREARRDHRAPTKTPPQSRWDGSGHLDAHYQARLLGETHHARNAADARAFLSGPRSRDNFAEELGEEAVETMTSGEAQGEDAFGQVVPEDDGGPFVTTTGSTEFAHGTDASNIKGATREPFPKT